LLASGIFLILYCYVWQDYLQTLPWLVFGFSSEPTFLLAAGLAQALGTAAGIINAFGLVAVFGGLIGACISALSERAMLGV
jgi:hypothetical protein